MNHLKCLLIVLLPILWGCEKNKPLEEEEDPTIIHQVFSPPVFFDIFGHGSRCDAYNDTFRLDLDNDLRNDLEFGMRKFCINCAGDTNFLVGYIWLDGLSDSTSNTALALTGDGGLPDLDTTLTVDSNFLLNTSAVVWEHRGFVMSLPCTAGGGGPIYINVGERYIAFYIEKGSDFYYGWLFMEADILKLTIKEFAISNVPNQPLGIGDY